MAQNMHCNTSTKKNMERDTKYNNFVEKYVETDMWIPREIFTWFQHCQLGMINSWNICVQNS